MTTYTTITNGQTDQDSPVTQTLMQALRDNVAATAEASTNAPVMVSGWHPNDMVNVGDGNDGKVYDFAVDGAITGLEIAVAAGFEYRVVFHDISFTTGGSGVFTFLIDVDQAIAASYTNVFTSTDTYSKTALADGWFDLYHPRLTASRFATINALIKGPLTTDNAQYYADVGTTDYVSKIRLRFDTDKSWDGGVVYVYRRQFLT